MSHPDTDFITAPGAPIGKQSLVNRKGSIESADAMSTTLGQRYVIGPLAHF